MDQTEFEDGLDRYGGDLGAWPAGLQDDAAALLVRSVAAQQAHRATRALEQVLAATRPRLRDVAATLATRASRRRQDGPATRAFVRFGLAAGFLSTLVIGILVGGSLVVPDDTPDHVLQAAFSTTETPDVD